MKNLKIFFMQMMLLMIMFSGNVFASEITTFPVPELEDSYVKYNGEIQTANLINFSDEYMNIENNKQKEVGEYEIIISLKDKENCLWKIYNEDTDTYTYTSGDQTLDWEIKIRRLDKPFANSQYYEGKMQKVKIRYFGDTDYKFVDFSGDYEATEIGTYKAILSLNDKENCIWEDGTTTDKEVIWNIQQGRISVPEVKSTPYYSGKEEEVKFWDYDEEIMDITGNKAVEAGTYEAVVSLKDKKNYTWEIYNEETKKYTYTTDDQIIEWKIWPKTISLSNQNFDRTYTGKEQRAKYNNDLVNISSDKGIDVGTYEATLSLKDKKNYAWYIYNEKTKNYTTTDDQIIEWKILPETFSLSNINFDMIYTGEEQIVKYNNDLVNISGDKGIDVGTYEATLILKDKKNYTWKIYNEETKEYTYTTDDQIIEWKIRKRSLLDPYKNSQRKLKSTYTGEEQSIPLKQLGLRGIDIDDLITASINSAKEAGIYNVILSLKDSKNYKWGGDIPEYSGDIEIEWEITEGILDIPYQADVAYYTGKFQEAVLEGFDEEIMDITGNSKKNVGTYYAVVSLKYPEKYKWENGTTDDVEVRWRIKKGDCTIEVVNRNLTLYTEDELEVLVEPSLTNGYLTVWYEEKNNGGSYTEEVPEETGLYKVKIEIKGDKNLNNAVAYEYIYVEMPGEVEWDINKKQVKLPILKYLYTGQSMEPTLEKSAEYKILNTEKGKDVGTYKMTVSIEDKEKYEWKIYDENQKKYIYTTDDQEIEWEIKKYTPVIYKNPQRKLTKNYNGKTQTIKIDEILGSSAPKGAFEITGNTAKDVGTYTLKISVEDTKNCNNIELYSNGKQVFVETTTLEWEILGTELPYLYQEEYTYADGENIIPRYYMDEEACTVKYPKGTDVGKYKIIFSLKDGFQWNDGTTDDITYEWRIVPKKVTVPEELIPQVYDGTQKKASLIGFDENIMNICDNEGIESGDYVAVVSLKDTKNYVWDAKNETEDQEVFWSIISENVKEKIALKVPTIKSHYYDGKKHKAEFCDEVIMLNGKAYSINELSDYIIIDNQKSYTNAGEYSTMLILKDKTMFEWKYYDYKKKGWQYTTEDMEATWEIYKYTSYVYQNSQRKIQKTYNGKQQTVEYSEIFKDVFYSSAIDEEVIDMLFNIEGNTAKEIGTHQILIGIKDFKNCEKIKVIGSKTEEVDSLIIEWEIVGEENEEIEDDDTLGESVPSSGNVESGNISGESAKDDSIEIGDIDGDNEITMDDAIYLFNATMFPEEYPISDAQKTDYNGDGTFDMDDAIYLFNHTMFPEEYPI